MHYQFHGVTYATLSDLLDYLEEDYLPEPLEEEDEA